MTLEEAYMRRHQECKALKRENSILSETVSKLRKGTYSDPDRIPPALTIILYHYGQRTLMLWLARFNATKGFAKVTGN